MERPSSSSMVLNGQGWAASALDLGCLIFLDSTKIGDKDKTLLLSDLFNCYGEQG